ncbi:disks large-associated protein 2-like [Hypanus sabinus]|uniref:disks large-associated protein 2-like n=1 Tax=Hypanus sabinus TaxID=79690 RepID=UPI0028C396E7|nr:disks large-associated protein 2-like [Hypanus sabinus]XP_059810383.1 disks large-associated protein 2-like [Hypanus sabinus]XP_059810384.1 disks large-associated protein 2-like [Hypanus sabinus]XP_059810385.1 disks large-associated protein 2-like [Hypanus sabinus]XP_059810386.1 disks large-associated protein 2-like [Hypanus sabinus]
MKGYNGSRSQLQHSSLHTCHCMPEDCDHSHDYLHHSQDPRQSYLLSPTDSCSMDHHYCVSRGTMSSECAGAPVSLNEQMSSSSTFPRMHHNPQYESCDDCMAATHTASKINRLPANLLDQFEKQLPLHHDGFHTLQYQRASSAEQRSESPSRIRHLVHSVQKLFAKSHSLEAPSKGNVNGTKAEGRGGSDGYHHHQHHRHHQHHHQSRSTKRSKSKERKSESKHRAKITGWWSSDDNLDSDSSYMVTAGSSRHSMDQTTQYCTEPIESAFRDLTLKSLKSSSEGKCLACAAMPMMADSQHAKRSAWSTMTVSQAREAYPSSSLNQDKSSVLQDIKAQERAYHYLQVPQDEWSSGYPGVNKDGEIPCRRMRSGSYIKAMGDDESGDSDASPKMSPKGAAQHENYLKSVSAGSGSEKGRSKFSCKHCSDPYICSHSHLQGQTAMNYSLDNLHRSSLRTPSKLPSRSQGYGRILSANNQVDNADLNRPFEVVCESVFGEVESQAVEALDLPGCFRMRSHSYLRAIQAGCSQDDDCLSVFSISAPMMPTTSVSAIKPSASFNYKKAPPVPPRMATKPIISVTAQSSTESTQDAYFQNEVNRPTSWSKDIKSQCNSMDSLDSTKALNLALESFAPSRSSMKSSEGTGMNKSALSRDEPKLQPRQRKWRSSVGIQVDSSETMTDSDTDSKGLREFHSIGVQVEDNKRHARFKRSNSVTTSVQADLELEGIPGVCVSTEDKGFQFSQPFERHSSEPEQSNEYTSFRTVHTQGQWAYRDDYRMRYDSADAQRQDHWGESSVHNHPDPGRVSPCHRDGDWFIKLLQAEVERLEGWCQQMEREAEENDLPEEVLEKIRSAVGSAQLLMSQKFQQFYRLCQQNMDPNAFPLPTSQDLAGFWDLLQLSVEDVTLKFDELLQIKANNWKLVEPSDRKDELKMPPPIPKKPPKGRLSQAREKSLELADKQRQEARKRLMAAKRAASYRQNSATESADSIEIYIPEAQTRL